MHKHIWTASWQNQQNGICAQWRLRSAWASAKSDQSSLCAWRKLGSSAMHWAHREDSDQTGRMPSLIWVFAGRTVILLVLSIVIWVWEGKDKILKLFDCSGRFLILATHIPIMFFLHLDNTVNLLHVRLICTMFARNKLLRFDPSILADKTRENYSWKIHLFENVSHWQNLKTEPAHEIMVLIT